jgi:hypothetical protein
LTYVSRAWRLVDRCPSCRAIDYAPLSDLMARCHRCGTVYARRWVTEQAVQKAVTKALDDAPHRHAGSGTRRPRAQLSGGAGDLSSL